MSDEKESLARAHLPYRAEYCKTSRAKCKKCSNPMDANTLKLANLTKSRFHDGYDANFYHIDCFFQIKRPSSVAEIQNYETLKYEDQQKLEKAIDTRGASILGTKVETSSSDKVSKSSRKAKKRDESEAATTGVYVNYDDYVVEYAKSNRSKCVVCTDKIDKDTVRLGKLDYDAETQWTGGPVPRWHHVDCFAKTLEQLEFYGKIEKIKNFSELEKVDRKMLKEKIKQIEPPASSQAAETNGKRAKMEASGSNGQAGAEVDEDKMLKKQSDRFFKLREFVDTMKRKDIEQMLEFMKQKSNFKNPSKLVDMATDVLLYGPLKKCPVCKHSRGMVLRGGSYICTRGDESEPCTYESRDPPRGLPDVPEDIIEKYYSFFDTYKFKGGKRLFPSKFVQAVEKKEALDNNIIPEGGPLEGLSIGVISWSAVVAEKSKVQKRVAELGGKIQTVLEKSMFVILSNEMEIEKNSPKIEVAKCLNIPFCTPEFLFRINKKEDVLSEVKKCIIGEWDGDLAERMVQLKSIKTEA